MMSGGSDVGGLVPQKRQRAEHGLPAQLEDAEQSASWTLRASCDLAARLAGVGEGRPSLQRGSRDIFWDALAYLTGAADAQRDSAADRGVSGRVASRFSREEEPRSHSQGNGPKACAAPAAAREDCTAQDDRRQVCLDSGPGPQPSSAPLQRTNRSKAPALSPLSTAPAFASPPAPSRPARAGTSPRRSSLYTTPNRQK